MDCERCDSSDSEAEHVYKSVYEDKWIANLECLIYRFEIISTMLIKTCYGIGDLLDDNSNTKESIVALRKLLKNKAAVQCCRERSIPDTVNSVSELSAEDVGRLRSYYDYLEVKHDYYYDEIHILKGFLKDALLKLKLSSVSVQ